MNIILLFSEVLVSSLILIYLYKKYQCDGIYIWIMLFSLLIGLFSQVRVEIFSMDVNLGVGINALLFIAENILVQKKGPSEVIKVISLVILSNVMLYCFSILTTICDVSDINVITNNAFDKVFYLNNRVYFSSVISILVSIWLDAMLYHQIRQIKNKIVISNVLSTIIIHFIECVIFCFMTYVFKMPIINVIELIVIRYIFKVIIGLVGTNVIYIVNSIER